MPLDFNNKNFTLAAVIFFLFCLHNSSYFAKKNTSIPSYHSQENIDYVNRAKYKIEVNPLKPPEELTYSEKLALMYMKFKHGNLFAEAKHKPGERLKISLTESVEGEPGQKNQEIELILGQKQVPAYIESSLYFQDKGEKKELVIYDNGIQKKKFVTVVITE